MLTLTLLVALAQSPAIRRATPGASDPGMVVRQVGTVEVNCTSGCSGSSGGGGSITFDGGVIGIVNQGTGADGGTGWVTYSPSIIDTNNSSSTPLAGGGVFTGTSTETLRANAVSVFVISNVASAAGGLSIQASADGTNWDHTHAISISANTGYASTFPLTLRYWRVIYTNGASAQASFRLLSLLHASASSGSIVTLSDIPTNDDHGQLTQSVIIGRSTAGGGAYVPVKVNPSGTMTVDGSGVTQPVSGSVTANAGTNLNTSALALETTATKVPIAQSTALGSNSGPMIQGSVTTAAPSYTTGNINPVSLTTAGDLRVRPTNTGSTGSAVPTTAGAVGYSDGTNLVIPRTYDTDNSGGVQNTLGVVLVGTQFGGAAQIGGEATPINGAGYVGLLTNPIRRFATNPAAKAVSCASTATAITSTPLTNRVKQCFLNNSAVPIYIGASGVTTAAGFPLTSDGGTYCDESGSQSFFCIVSTGTGELRVLEN